MLLKNVEATIWGVEAKGDYIKCCMRVPYRHDIYYRVIWNREKYTLPKLVVVSTVDGEGRVSGKQVKWDDYKEEFRVKRERSERITSWREDFENNMWIDRAMAMLKLVEHRKLMDKATMVAVEHWEDDPEEPLRPAQGGSIPQNPSKWPWWLTYTTKDPKFRYWRTADGTHYRRDSSGAKCVKDMAYVLLRNKELYEEWRPHCEHCESRAACDLPCEKGEDKAKAMAEVRKMHDGRLQNESIRAWVARTAGRLVWWERRNR